MKNLPPHRARAPRPSSSSLFISDQPATRAEPDPPSRKPNKGLIPSHRPKPTTPYSRMRQPDAQLEAEGERLSLTAAFLAASPEPTTSQPANINTTALAESFRHSCWMPTRKKIDSALQAAPGVTPRRLEAFRTCGCDARVEGRYLSQMKHAVEYRILSTKCHDRFCLPCSQERARLIRSRLLDHMFKRKQLSLITFTMVHRKAPLKTQLDEITLYFRKLRGMKIWKKNVKGGVCIIEAKVGKDDGLWHIHMHTICEARYIHQPDLVEAWREASGGSFIVDVRRVGAMTGAVQYVTKYVTKAADQTVINSRPHLVEAVVDFAGRRLVSTFGTWRGLKLTERLDDGTEYSPHASGWFSVGTLGAVLALASAGDADSKKILLAVRRGRTTTAPPPDAAPF